MRYAIMQSDTTELLKILDFRDYDYFDWDKFRLVKSLETDEIILFGTEDEASDFMYENFDESVIEVFTIDIEDKYGKYYVD